jgi:hypothetical protein
MAGTHAEGARHPRASGKRLWKSLASCFRRNDGSASFLRLERTLSAAAKPPGMETQRINHEDDHPMKKQAATSMDPVRPKPTQARHP